MKGWAVIDGDDETVLAFFPTAEEAHAWIVLTHANGNCASTVITPATVEFENGPANG